MEDVQTKAVPPAPTASSRIKRRPRSTPVPDVVFLQHPTVAATHRCRLLPHAIATARATSSNLKVDRKLQPAIFLRAAVAVLQLRRLRAHLVQRRHARRDEHVAPD